MGLVPWYTRVEFSKRRESVPVFCEEFGWKDLSDILIDWFDGKWYVSCEVMNGLHTY